MTNFLAIDTATDACSVAVRQNGECRELFEIIPRQHSQRVFGMLRELLPDGNLPAQGIDALAYSCGPGSFTGLRICASLVQGLAFASNLPAVPVSSLACLAHSAWREGLADQSQALLVLLDARINEIYWGLYEAVDGVATLVGEEGVCAPSALAAQIPSGCFGVGSGFAYVDELPAALGEALDGYYLDSWPHAQDLFPAADARMNAGLVQRPEQVIPVYIRDEVSWKKLDEQGKRP